MSDSDEALNTAALATLQAELTRLRDSVVTGWQSYQAWSTWFHGIQAVVLGWIVAKADQLPSPENAGVLASVFLVLNLLAMLGTLRLRSFVALQTGRADTVCRHIVERVRATGLDVEITPGFPSSLFLLSGSITMAVCAIAILICSFLLWDLSACRA
jgi:hypothetical protein